MENCVKRKRESNDGKEVQSKKRMDYISWQEYFMGVARLTAMRSKDPATQVGACIVNSDNKVVGVGYNGMPIGCSDDELPWNKKADTKLDTKHLYVCHAEMNAIMNKNAADLAGCTLYTTLFPCNECAKLIIQARIKSVVYLAEKNPLKPKFKASKILLDMAKVECSKYSPTRSQITINLTD